MPLTPKKLTLLTQWFDPEPAYRGLGFAKDMAAQGFEVDVVTGFPNYPGGVVYDGYKIRLIQREVMDGIPVTRLPLYPSHSTSKIGRILNYVSFFLSALIYLTLRRGRADLVYVYHPPVTVAVAAVLSQWVRRAPVVLEIQDMWPDTLSSTGMIRNARILRLVGYVCKWVYGRARHIVVQSPGFKTLLLDRGVAAEKITTVLGWADEEVLPASVGGPTLGFRPDPEFRVLFAGNMGFAQALSPVLDVAQRLQNHPKNITFYFIGRGIDKDRLHQEAQNKGLDNVAFLPQVPMAEIGAYLSAADCLLVHLRDDPLFAITIPSKTQAYLSMGKPVLMGVRGDAGDLVAKSGGGIVVPPENPDALEQAVLHLADLPPKDLGAMGIKGLAFYQSHMARALGLRAFKAAFETAMQPK